MTIIGKAMYNPISNASDRFSEEEGEGMTPPSVAAFSSSSEASHDFIFSSRVSVVVEASCSTSSLVLYNVISALFNALFFSRNDDVLCAAEFKWSGDEGKLKPLTTDSCRAACSKAAVKRSERIMMTCNSREIYGDI